MFIAEILDATDTPDHMPLFEDTFEDWASAYAHVSWLAHNAGERVSGGWATPTRDG